MNFAVRKTDSLAHATGSCIGNLKEIRKKGTDESQQIVDDVKKILRSFKQSNENQEEFAEIKEEVLLTLQNLGKTLNSMEETIAGTYTLMVEIDGLDFPLKTPKKMMNISKKEEDVIALLKNVAQNISKTLSFVQNDQTSLGLFENSLNSLETSYEDYVRVIKQTSTLLDALDDELDKEHKKAKKTLKYV